MAGEVCPLFQRIDGETVTLVGAWMLHAANLGISPDLEMYPELGHIRSLVASFFATQPFKTVENTTVTLGRGCGFQGGSFLMGADYAAPNESGGKAFEYSMKNNGGVIICVRE